VATSGIGPGDRAAAGGARRRGLRARRSAVDELTRSAADLTARHPKNAEARWATRCATWSARRASRAALDAADAALGGFDAVVVTAGPLRHAGQVPEADLEFTRRMLTVNYAHTVVFCEHARTRLLSRGGGRLAVFSSVAGDRGRKPVALYGSSKAGLTHYLESLDHKHHAEGLSVLCVKPGFVKTSMTEGLKPPPFAGEPAQVARDVVRALDRRRAVLYTPGMWALVMLVIRWLPRFVMRKIGF
jgi:decaprenylphospho-beta-D-erythro-pentofuranosid-2-ulose 2-reductase